MNLNKALKISILNKIAKSNFKNDPERKYKFRFSFSKKEAGVFTGRELIHGDLSLTLAPYGQEIIEIAEIK